MILKLWDISKFLKDLGGVTDPNHPETITMQIIFKSAKNSVEKVFSCNVILIGDTLPNKIIWKSLEGKGSSSILLVGNPPLPSQPKRKKEHSLMMVLSSQDLESTAPSLPTSTSDAKMIFVRNPIKTAKILSDRKAWIKFETGSLVSIVVGRTTMPYKTVVSNIQNVLQTILHFKPKNLEVRSFIKKVSISSTSGHHLNLT
ncbi:putative 50S ribosomal subunit protein L1 [Candidatus Tremblaya phenacola PAVE]|nr:putative 50S ribosomal subunit protein L1 [Candidatus Tremblaya phenacola PAVE]